MAKKKSTAKPSAPKTFTAMMRPHPSVVKKIGRRLRELLYEEMPDAEESFSGTSRPLALYRTRADVCFLQPIAGRCNLYFVRGPELTDPDGLLQGNSDRIRHVKVPTLEVIDELPIRDWIRESLELNDASIADGIDFDETHQRLQQLCLALPETKETNTWGKPHFRVGEKIFCGCGENHGVPQIGLKMSKSDSTRMMKLPGIEKAPYSRPGDGWVSINPQVFDDWEEIGRFIVDSFCLIAPQRVSKKLNSPGPQRGTKKRK